jgi:endogenous inhibitor of DNA gyrase (YacG/DUF329 family)
VGTAEVEALSAFVWERAKAHNVTLMNLWRYEILPVMCELFQGASKSFHPSKLEEQSKRLNGLNHYTKRFIVTMSYLTGSTQLVYSSMMPLSNIISSWNLIREWHAWCSQCYQKQKNNQNAVYDYLCWSLQDFNWCLEHNSVLQHRCPKCGRNISRLSSRYRPGYCPHCDVWLGTEVTQSDTTDQVKAQELDLLHFRSHSINELISAVPSMKLPLQPGLWADGIRSAIEVFDSGNLASFTTRVGFKCPATIHNLLKQGMTTSLRNLLQICECLGISLKHLILYGEVFSVHRNPDSHPRTVHRSIADSTGIPYLS